MSRIGKKPIRLLEGVLVSLSGNLLEVRGPRGLADLKIHPEIGVELTSESINVKPRYSTKGSAAQWGTVRALIANMVKGVTEGFEKKLEVEGVGYRVELKEKDLVLLIGFSHPVKVTAPPGISFRVEKNTITVSGVSKEQVGQVSSSIRELKKPEPYKGKGIRYAGEVIRRKAGKKGQTAS